MTEIKVPYLAPGCFGSALHFQKKSMTCAACPFSGDCEPAHCISLQTMRDKLGIVAPTVRSSASLKPVKNEVDCDDPARLTLPKKVRELLGKLDREDLGIVEKMRSGINPFSGLDRYRYLLIACHLIMKMQTPVTQKTLSAGLIKSLHWANGTADAHARMAVQALCHVGAIENNDGILSVRRN